MIPRSAPTPRYEMRRRLTLRVISQFEPGRFIETGCGWGELLPDLVGLGFSGVAVEPAQKSREIAIDRTENMRHRVNVVPSIADVPGRDFDYLLSFEVLEHVEDDLETLRSWTKRLRPGGKALISVPAHMNRWSSVDVSVGHFRRYDAADIEKLVDGSDLHVDSLWTYGFPVTSITRRLRSLPDEECDERSQAERTLASAGVSHALGSVSPPKEGALKLVGGIADLLQRPFLSTRLGDGYFVVATKRC